jgi:outer membrane protein assembly factor BamE (lipoprotein component of BamABCDE complex)
MKITCQAVALLLCAATLSSCTTSGPEIVHTRWGRCGELAKTQHFSSASTRRLEREVFYGFQSQKMLELCYLPPIVEVRTFDKTGKVTHLERRNLSHLAHANRGRPDFELLYFPVVSHTQSGYIRVDYFNHILNYPDRELDTVVYFRKDKCPENPFEKLQNGMSRMQVENLAGKPISSELQETRVRYYSGIFEITIDYERDSVARVKSEKRKRYE